MKSKTIITIASIILGIVALIALVSTIYLLLNPSIYSQRIDGITLNPNDVEFPDHMDSQGCVRYMYSDPLGGQETFFINSDEDYQQIQDDYALFYQCEWITPAPKIDFSQYSLLGQMAHGGGCTIDFERSVYVDEINDIVTYTVDVKEKGLCEMAGFSLNWVTVPKIPEGYDVKFEVK